jgi:nucleoid-associated protein YgaU
VIASKPAPVPSAGTKTGPAEDKAMLAAKTEAPQAPPKPAQVATAATATAPSGAYVVVPGDTLSKLAQRFYNSNLKWAKIYEANRDTLKNPHYIYVGQNLVIPPDDGR